MLIRSLDVTPKILGKFFKMLKIGCGEDFKMSERISTPARESKNFTEKKIADGFQMVSNA